jgi:hypothetical protein
MFDLEQQIRQWRQSLAGALGGQAEVVEELEGHLREEVQRLVRSGQSPDRAWEAALSRLGTAHQLAGEFGKLPPSPAVWLPGRLALLAMGAVAVLLGCLLLLQFLKDKMDPLLAVHVYAITVGYTAMFAAGALAVWSLLARATRGWDAQRAATLRYYSLRLTLFGLGLTALGVVLGGWWARDHLGRYWGWDVKELGGLAVLLWYGVMLGCLRWRPSGWLAAMVVGVAGNVVVSLSWFGAPLVSPLHSYGYSGYAPILLAFVVSQGLILLLALVPPGRMIGQRS